ncbi:MAG: bifunctional folylpolyglutamate synthase/dihydrofolate synthase, partial [Bacteroidia bacterium]
ASAYKADLNNTVALCAALENPERKFKSIHIAGTNGKGSSSHMLASVLQAQGYKTGLYTSPHLRDFRERIRINGVMIPEEEVIRFTHTMEEAILRIEPSFFELTMAMAFTYFAEEKTDIAVIETGMGGRLDSTNILLPELCLITNIGYDHMEFLGNDLASIAAEKAGIIKKNTPVVIGKTQPETQAVFEKKAGEMEAPLLFADTLWTCRLMGKDEHFQSFSVQRNADEHLNLKLDLMGKYQVANLPGVLEALYQLNSKGFPCDEESIIKGLSHVQSATGLMGRWQQLSEKPRVICDTGHNEDGIREVVRMLEEENFENLHVVIGMVSDKEVGKVLTMLPKDATYYFTRAAIPRALPASELQEKAALYDLKGEVYERVADALNAAKQAASERDLIFVGGSTFVVAEVV